MVFLQIFFVLVVLSSVSAFMMKGKMTTAKLNMNAWGVQKLGKSLLDQSVPVVEQQEEEIPSRFKRAPVGSGKDERKMISFKKDQASYDEEKNSLLSSIDKSFMQKNLLMGLESEYWGSVEKLQRIQLAASVDNLLPSSLSTTNIRTSSMHAGGLFEDDWDF